MTQPSLSINPGRLGRYEIVDELGKGAMGVVYLARDPLIGRLVALKTFRIGYSVKDQELEQFRARFIREAQSAGILSHPGIVTVHDVVEESEEGVAFIAMEYLRGTNLKMLLQRDGPLDVEAAAAVLDQVADGLDYAHSRGVVHRDVKPANIILTADNRVKITDFGIARLDTSNLTQEGQLLGTPNYMAPEQILGKEVDHRADIFSLGIVLYEMLTRHKPFQGDNLTVVSHRIVYDHFTPPRQYAQDLPPGVERVLSRALEKDPAQRYQRARDLADDLRRAIHREPQPAGEALNETLNLSATSAVPLPELVPPLPRRFRRSWLSWRERAAGALSRGLARRPSSERLATEAFAAAFLSVLIGTVALFALGWGPVPPPTPEEQARGEVLPWLAQGNTHLRAGRYEEAIRAYREAERLAPDLPGPRRMREQAEGYVGELNRLVEQEKQVHDQLAQARLAMARRQFQDAVLATRAVLAVQAGNAEAQEILEQATAALARPSAPKRLRIVPSAGQDRAQLAEERPAAEPTGERVRTHVLPQPVATDAILTLQFDSALPKGVFKLMRNGTTIHEEKFDFYVRKNIFRKVAHGGKSIGTMKVPAGAAKLRVYVVAGDSPAEIEDVEAEILGGSEYRLNVILGKDGKVSAFIEDLSGSS